MSTAILASLVEDEVGESPAESWGVDVSTLFMPDMLPPTYKETIKSKVFWRHTRKICIKGCRGGNLRGLLLTSPTLVSIPNPPVTLEQNYLYKTNYSPDYKGISKTEVRMSVV